MSSPTLKAIIATVACALATACAGPTQDVRQIQRTQYALNEETAAVLVREALQAYPLVERGNGRFETRWLRGRDGSTYKLAVRIDGPGGGPFMVHVDARLRERSGAIVEYDVPSWLAKERDLVVVNIYERMKPAAIQPEIPATVAAQ